MRKQPAENASSGEASRGCVTEPGVRIQPCDGASAVGRSQQVCSRCRQPRFDAPLNFVSIAQLLLTEARMQARTLALRHTRELRFILGASLELWLLIAIMIGLQPW